MASNFITKSEIVKYAFDNNLDQEYISDDDITIAEIEHIKPALTSDLYDRLNAANSGLEEKEVELKVLLKKPIAYFVKSMIIPDLNIQVGNAGVFSKNVHQAENVGVSGTKYAQQIARDNAVRFLKIAEQFITDNLSSFENYYTASGAIRQKVGRFTGGIIIRK